MTGVGITLHALRMRGAFDAVDAKIEPGSYTQVIGATGTGGPELLLTIAGRLKGFKGKGFVNGYPLSASRVRSLMGVARISGVIESDGHLRLKSLTRGLDSAAVEKAWEVVGIQPPPEARLEELAEADKLLVEVGLCVAAKVRGIVVDGADTGLTADDVLRVSAALRAVSQSGQTVVATKTRPDRHADLVLNLPGRGHV